MNKSKECDFCMKTLDVKKNKRDDRITKVENSKNLFKIFSGKWVNCFETAEEISKII